MTNGLFAAFMPLLAHGYLYLASKWTTNGLCKTQLLTSFFFIVTVWGDCGSSQLYLSVCLCICVSVPLLRLISRLLWVGFWSNLVEMLELRSDWLYQNLSILRQRDTSLIRGNFFLHLYAFHSNSSRLRHTYFFENFEHSAGKGNTTHKGNFFFLHFYAFQCISSRLRHTFFLKILSILREREMPLKKTVYRETIMLRQTVTLTTAILSLKRLT